MNVHVVVAIVFAALAAWSPREDVRDAEVGVRWKVPAAWNAGTEHAKDPKIVALLVRADGVPVQLDVRVDLALGRELDELVEQRRALLEREGYASTVASEQKFGRHAAKGLELTFDRQDQGWRMRELFVVDDEFVYALRTICARERWDELEPSTAAAWSGLSLAAPKPTRSRARREAMLAGLCGSELAWAIDWRSAAARAAAEKRLVLVYVNSYRGFDMPDLQRISTFMDSDIVGVLNASFVPLDLGKDRDVPFAAQSSYGMSESTFGASCLIVTPEGEVIAERKKPDYDFLRTIARPRVPLDESVDSLERARVYAERGEHDLAREVLAGRQDAGAALVRADLLRREQNGAQALVEFEHAREAGGDSAEIALDEAWVLLRLDRRDDLRAAARDFLDAAPEHARAPEARFLLGLTFAAAGEARAAERTWSVLIEDQPGSRWAWQAAAILGLPTWKEGQELNMAWLEPALRAEFEVVPYAPLPGSAAERVRADAIAWLLEHQRADGSWPVETAARRSSTKPPDDFELANAAFAVRGLLAAREVDGVEAAIARALAYLIEACARVRAHDGDLYYMDYAVWSRSSVLLALLEATDAGLLERDALRRIGRWLIQGLLDRQSAAGGWSYYVTNDLKSGATRSTSSFSFVTAHVWLALHAADRAGLEVPQRVLSKALDALAAMQTHPSLFEYSLGANSELASLPGAAGRAPLCQLALFRGGRADVDELAASFDVYLAHVGGLTKELGKSLMHAGPHGQGCHYPLFDHHWAAEALAELSPEQREGRAVRLLDALLEARCEDGSFYDMPGLGNAWGTAVAVRAVSQLVSAPADAR